MVNLKELFWFNGCWASIHTHSKTFSWRQVFPETFLLKICSGTHNLITLPLIDSSIRHLRFERQSHYE